MWEQVLGDGGVNALEAVLSLAQKYPSGLTEVVLRTEAVSSRSREWREPDSDLSVAKGHSALLSQLPDQLSLSEALALASSSDYGRSLLLVRARVATSQLVGPAGGEVAVLTLQDGSVRRPVATYLHSALLPLAKGPEALLSSGGVVVRALLQGRCTLFGQHGDGAARPVFMPSRAFVAELPGQLWAPADKGTAQDSSPAWLQRTALPFTRCVTIPKSRREEAGPKGSGREDALPGWLLASVVGPSHEQDSPCSPHPTCQSNNEDACMTLRSGSVASSSLLIEADEDDGMGGCVSTRAVLVLRGDVAHIGRLLTAGDRLAVYRPRPCSALARHAWDTPHLELSRDSLIVMRSPEDASGTGDADAASDQENRAAGAPASLTQQQQHQQRACGGDSGGGVRAVRRIADVVEGAQCVALCGTVTRLHCAAGRAAVSELHACLQDNTGTLEVHLMLGGTAGGAALFRQLREGHVLLLLGAHIARSTCSTAVPWSQRQPLAQRRAAVGSAALPGTPPRRLLQARWCATQPHAQAQDLSCLPALLHSPALQRRTTLATALEALRSQRPHGGGDGFDSLAPAGPCAAITWPMDEPLVVRVTLQRLKVALRNTHRRCGRLLRRVSLGYSDGGAGSAAFDSSGDGSSSQDVNGLWECVFCSVECGAGDSEVSLTGHASLADASGAAGAVQLSPCATSAVLSLTSHAFLAAPPAQRARALEEAKGRVVDVVLCGGSPDSPPQVIVPLATLQLSEIL